MYLARVSRCGECIEDRAGDRGIGSLGVIGRGIWSFGDGGIRHCGKGVLFQGVMREGGGRVGEGCGGILRTRHVCWIFDVSSGVTVAVPFGALRIETR